MVVFFDNYIQNNQDDMGRINLLKIIKKYYHIYSNHINDYLKTDVFYLRWTDSWKFGYLDLWGSRILSHTFELFTDNRFGFNYINSSGYYCASYETEEGTLIEGLGKYTISQFDFKDNFFQDENSLTIK